MKKTLRWRIAQFAENKWWRNYLKHKDAKEYFIWKKTFWQNLLSQLNLQTNNSHLILDAGCGPAGIFIAFENNSVTAFDPLLSQYEKLPHFNKQNFKNVNFIESALENFNSEIQYDYVFCMNAINHVQDLNLAYDKLVQACKPNGKIIVSIDAHNHKFYRKLFALLPGDILHPHQYNLSEYEKFLTLRNCAIQQTIKLKKEYFFDHYVQVAVKN